MDNTIIVAIISGAFTLIGTLGGIVASGKLTAYRIEQLEKKVDKHNSVIERMYKLEESDAVFKEEIKTLTEKIKDLEEYHK